MPDLLFSDNRLRDIHRRAYQDFCARPEIRDWLLSHLHDGVYLRFGPFGWHENHLLLPVRVGEHCIDLVYWHMDVEPETMPAKGSEKPETYYPDESFQIVDGTADVFGVEAMSRAIIYGTPLKIFRSPWQLLLAASEGDQIYLNDSLGAVLLNRELKCWAALSQFKELHAENREHAIEIRRCIKASGAKPPLIKFPKESGPKRVVAA